MGVDKLCENVCNVCVQMCVGARDLLVYGPYVWTGLYVEVRVTCVHAHMGVDPGVWECLCVFHRPCTTCSSCPPEPASPPSSQSPQHVNAPPSCMRLAALSKRKLSCPGGAPVPGPPGPCPLYCVIRMGAFSPAPSTICCFPRSLRPKALRGVPGGAPPPPPRPIHPVGPVLV